MAYNEAILRVSSYKSRFTPSLGLENITKLHSAIERPFDGLRIVHVAGTNGKGSVCLKLAHCIQAVGKRVGLFVSPHISCFRERIQVNQEKISEDSFASLAERVCNAADENDIPASIFEIATAIAGCHFVQEVVDFVVLETGCGGRLDATNIVNPIASVITSVALDHTHLLGNTIEEIATEKAGIIKPGRPVFIGPNTPHQIIETIASSLSSPLYSIPNPEIAGDIGFDLINQRIVWEVISWMIEEGLLDEWNSQMESALQIRPPCRFEEMLVPASKLEEGRPAASVRVILDVGHNPEAVRNLLCALSSKYGNRTIRLVLGISHNKDIQTCLREVLRYIPSECIHIVHTNNYRAASGPKLWDLLCEACLLSEKAAPAPPLDDHPFDVHHTILFAIQEAAKSQIVENTQEFEQIVVINGTFLIMPEARQALGLIEDRDIPEISQILALPPRGVCKKE